MKLKKSTKSFLIESGETGITELTETIESLDKFHKYYYIRTLKTHKPEPINLIGQNMIIFIQGNLFRFKNITDGYVNNLNNNNPLCSIILLRALYETTGAIALLHKKYEQYKEHSLTEEEFENVINKLYLSSKSKNIPEAFEPYNVMTLIDAVDYLLKKRFDSNEKKFRTSYDRLSEISHPNNYGYFLGIKINQDLSSIDFTDETKQFPAKNYYLEYFALIAEIYKFIYIDIRETIEQLEDLPYILLKEEKTKSND